MSTNNWHHVNNNANGGGAVYGIGLLGALFYFIPQAGSFVEGIVLFLKALLWPAFLVYGIFNYLHL